MECKEIIGKLDRYLENRLNDIEKYKIEKHLERCSKCKSEYEELKEVFDILSNHPIILPPQDFTCRIMNEIKLKTKQNKIEPLMMKKWGISFVAAGLLIFVLNTSFGYSVEDISSYIYKESFDIDYQISNYIKKVPTVLSNTYKKLNIDGVKFFKNIRFNK